MATYSNDEDFIVHIYVTCEDAAPVYLQLTPLYIFHGSESLDTFQPASQIFCLMLISVGKKCKWVLWNDEALNEKEMKELAAKPQKNKEYFTLSSTISRPH